MILQELYLPDEVTEIEKGGFEGCSGMKRVYFSKKKNLQIIGENAFRDCYSLKYMATPDGVTTIGARAFSGCTGLKTIILHKGLTSIEESAFEKIDPLCICGYASEGDYIKKYALQNNISYVSLDAEDRSIAGFSAARDGWCLINSPDLYGGTDLINSNMYLLLYDIRPSSLVHSFVISLENMIREEHNGVDGRCFGFSILAVANYEGKINLRNYFSGDGDGLNAYGYQSITGTEEQNQMFSIKDNEKVQWLLDRTHISQKSKEFKATEVFKWDSDYSELLAEHNSGNMKPYVVTLQNFNGYQHAVAIDTSKEWVSDGGSRYQIPLYNPNTPYITKHLDTPSTLYGQKKSCLQIDTATGDWILLEDGNVIAESGYYFFGLEIYSIRFYDPTKLPKDFFTGRLHLTYTEKKVFARIEMATEDLYCYLTDKMGDVLLEVKGGIVTRKSDQIELADMEIINGKLKAFSVELPKDVFNCRSSSGTVSVIGENGYLYGAIEGAGTVTIDPQEISCKVKSENSSATTVELQKKTGENTYIAASFEGTVREDDTTFSFYDENSASISSEDKNNSFNAAVDNGIKTVQYEDLKVKNAEEISPDKGITSCREGEHSYKTVDKKEPSCIIDGYWVQRCNDCHIEQRTNIPATGVHTYGSWSVVREATALMEGEEVQYCNVCGDRKQRSTARLTPTISVNVTSIPLKVKQSTNAVKVSGLAAGDYIVSWRSSNSKIASVTSSGKITAKKKTGKAVVTVRLASGLEKNITVKVQKKAVTTTSIRNVKKNMTLQAGKSTVLQPMINPVTSTQKVTYKSSNKKVAVVNSKGKITAKKKGKAVITVKSGKKTVKCKVTVR